MNKKIKELKEIEKVKKNILLPTCQNFEVSLEPLLDTLKIDKSVLPIIVMSELTYCEKIQVEAKREDIQAKALLWLQENKINVNDNLGIMAVGQKVKALMIDEYFFELVRSHIVNIISKGSDLAYKKDSDGFFEKETFERLPIVIVNLLLDRLLINSSLTESERIAL